jgi:DNA-binding beta-propeller fold protein YncE
MLKSVALLSTLLLLGTTVPAQQILLVLQKHDDSLGWYDSQTGKPLGRAAKVGHIPHEFVLSLDEQRAYVTNYGVDSYNSEEQGGNTLSVVDLKQHRTERQIDLSQYHRPHGIAIGRSGRLYVTCDLPPRVLVVDPSKGKVLHAADVKAKGPHMVVVSQHETHVWAADALSGTVTDIDLQHDDSVKQIEIGGVPMGMVLSEGGEEGGERLYATTHADKLTVIDTARDRLLAPFRFPVSQPESRGRPITSTC